MTSLHSPLDPPPRHFVAPTDAQAEAAMLQGVVAAHDNLIDAAENTIQNVRDGMASRATGQSFAALAELADRYQQFVLELRALRPMIEKVLAD